VLIICPVLKGSLVSIQTMLRLRENPMTKSKKTVSKRQNVASADYAKFVTQLKKKIRSAQFKAALAVNRELIRLYWEAGKSSADKKKTVGVLVS
jgi:hypothetical protein